MSGRTGCPPQDRLFVLPINRAVQGPSGCSIFRSKRWLSLTSRVGAWIARITVSPVSFLFTPKFTNVAGEALLAYDDTTPQRQMQSKGDNLKAD